MLTDRASKALATLNLKLKAIGLAITVRYDKFYVVGVLPPKPNSGKDKPCQQRISLDLPANFENLKDAERMARIINAEVVAGIFDWSIYIKRQAHAIEASKIPTTWGEVVDNFEPYYRAKHDLKLSTWRFTYYPYIRRVPRDEPIAPEPLLKVVSDIDPSKKRSRQMAIQALKFLAKFAGVTVDFEELKVRRTQDDKQERYIPSEDEILNSINLFPRKPWKHAYALMACYGLRPHELAFLDLSEFPAIRVTGGKTGYLKRKVYPLHTDWIEIFGLKKGEIVLPKCKSIGPAMAQAFRRNKIPFSPYSLRHYYAIYGTVKLKKNVVVMARMLGHSPSIHLDTYNHWINEQQVDEDMRSPNENHLLGL